MNVYRVRVRQSNGVAFAYYVLARSIGHAAAYVNRYSSVIIQKL